SPPRTPETLPFCPRQFRAKCSWPTGSSRPWIPPCERCTPRRNPGFSFPTRLVSFEIFPTIWWPHSGRLSTKRWTPPFCIHVVDAADPAFRSHIQVTKEVLEDIGAGKLPSLAILNKIDLV